MDLSTYIGQIASLKEEFLTVMPLTTDVGDQCIQIDKFFMVLCLLASVQISRLSAIRFLAGSSVPSLDDVFARLLRISSTQTLPSDNTSDSSVLVLKLTLEEDTVVTEGRGQRLIAPIAISLATLVIGVISYIGGLPTLPTPPSQLLVAQTGNASACLTHTSSLGPWILASGASDHISSNKDLFSSITTTSTLPTVTLANGSQTIAKEPEYGEDDWHRTNNAREYFSAPFTSFMSHHGIIHQSSCAHTPQQNGVAEPCYLINRMPSSVLHDQIPHSLLFPDQPLYFLPPRVFGCTCFVHILTPGQDKLSARATKCIFLGYSRLQKGYRCYSSETHRYFLSADVTFFEDSPFFSTSESLPVSEVLPLPIISPPDAVPSRPLQVYHRRHRVAVPPSLAEVPADSLPIPSASPAPALPPSADLPIALRKSTPEALSHPGWRQAMVDEMAALHSNGTWDLVVLPSGKSTVGCRWVYTVKVGPDGQVDRLKARLVAKGYTQVYGSDYGDTFSPVAKIASVRLLLSMAAMRSWPLYQLDIKNAFLHGDLAEEVYMEQPPGFVAQGESGLVCRLRRSLYGLKQSPRAWFSRFSSVVQEFGMFRSTADHSVFYHHNSSGQCIYLVVYVDDIVITGSDQNGIQKLKQHLFTHFQTKDLGKLKYFLGIEIAQSSSGVVLSQRKYALDILEETGMLDCKPVDTPMDPNVKLIPGQGEPLGDPGRYRRLVGKLNYLTITRPDISFPVSVVSQFLQSPCDSHWDAVIRILRYIKSTPGQGVLYENRGHTQLLVTQMQIGLAHPQIDVPLRVLNSASYNFSFITFAITITIRSYTFESSGSFPFFVVEFCFAVKYSSKDTILGIMRHLSSSEFIAHCAADGGCMPMYTSVAEKSMKGGPRSLVISGQSAFWGGLYKMLAKVLANRLKKVIDKVVSYDQNAFVKGRQILDASLIANEVIDNWKKKGDKGVIWKLDIEKAYDSINWQFLLKVMEKMGFGAKC
ncbi:Retrovirus-related Pol polyprotein from transposon TNT 1-94 [Vitis vinifera]|uniref:Retrovirus-related Pol polyprotein from transposon TNT 1-94 n=1 Tax=Vitis vinifera TaxID=29760 RepID=A0A438ENB2_VITVI|nr:Retrovirus-related Pol polyprotein from transposon TNT 1-94 [Vitis vinifera]